MLKVGIIGLGTISFIHKLAIEASRYGQLVAVCDIDDSKQKNYSKFPFYTDYQQMLKKESIDVVHICLPHYLHARVTMDCLNEGVHVFLEKPVSLNYSEGSKLNEFVKLSKQKVGVCFQNRCNRTSRILINLLKQPENGVITALKANVTWFRDEIYYKEQAWRGTWNQAGGGTIINQSIHTLDLLQLFSKQSVIDCKGVLTQLLDYGIEVEDTAIARFNFTENVKVLFYATNAYSTNSSVEIEVLTTKKRYIIKDYRLFETNLTEGEIPQVICEDEIAENTKSYYGQGHNMIIDEFYRAIVDNTQAYVTVEDALISMQMIDLIKQSNQLNRKVRVEELK